MRAKSMVLIFIALVCGLVASIGISQVMDSNSSDEVPAVETEEVYVAVADIDIDEQLTSENVKLEGWPAGKVPENAARSFEDIEGMYPNMRFVEGEPILLTKVRNSHQSPVIHIEKGYRVIPIEVRRDTISDGLINPGDRVDIVGYFRASQEIPQTMTRKILRNVRLFAVNSETERTGVDDQGNQANVQTVSLLIPDSQVNKLLLAMELGTLRMTLRRPDEDDAEITTDDATVDMLFHQDVEDADAEDEEFADTDTPSILETWDPEENASDETDVSNEEASESLVTVTQPAAPAFTMFITGPTGERRKFVWQADDSPVQEVFDDEFNHIGSNPMMSENEYNVPEESAEDSQNADKSGLEFDEET